MRPRRLLAAALLASAALAAGCGGTGAETKNAYVADVQAAQQLYVTNFAQVRKRLTATSTDVQDRATLGAFATATQRFVAALGRITPPEEVRAEHAKLTAAARDYGRQVTGAQARLTRGTTADRAAVRTELSSSVQGTQEKIAAAIAAINAGLQG